MNFEAILRGAVKIRASDIHLIPSEQPVIRVSGDLRRVNGDPLTEVDVREVVNRILPPNLRPALEENRGVDFSYQYADLSRFRCVAYYEKEVLGLAMRVIPVEIPTIDELEFPPCTKDISLFHRGMVLVTGITGSGKTTTLAAMINHLNHEEARRVITIEDPIEYIYRPLKCVISQREVGKDIRDFSDGLRQALRMDPDVILIGEMRDVETIRVAIKASETGHLVFSTLHTTNAIHTVQRILSHFPEAEQDLVREQLSLNLRASISQRLVRRSDKPGRMAAMEILVVNGVIAKLIKDNRITDCVGVMVSREAGMQVFDQALADLVRAEKMTMEEGRRHCDDFYAFRRHVQGIQSSGEAGSIIAG